MQWVEICGYNIVNAYIAPNCVLSEDDFAQILPVPSNIKTLIFGDFNAHHRSWGSTTNNTRGIQLARVIDRFNLVLLNTTNPTRLNTAINSRPEHRWSLLDLSLATSDMAQRCTTNVTNEFLGSDHSIVTTSVNVRIITTDISSQV